MISFGKLYLHHGDTEATEKNCQKYFASICSSNLLSSHFLPSLFLLRALRVSVVFFTIGLTIYLLQFCKLLRGFLGRGGIGVSL